MAIERTVSYRKGAAGTYSSLPYAFAQVAIETIYVAIQTLAYGLTLFSTVGFTPRVDKFFWFFLLMCFICFTLCGMMLVDLTPGHQIAAIVMSFFLSFWILFSGFLLPGMNYSRLQSCFNFQQIPIWWRWYYWGSPVAWTILGLVTFQVGDRSPLVEIPGETHMSVQIYY